MHIFKLSAITVLLATNTILVSSQNTSSSVTGPRVLREIPYVAAGDPLQKLDLFLPRGNKSFSTVLFIHGGSLTSGDKDDDDYRGICSPFAESGMACATVNYRIFPAVKWPAPEQDVASAFAWLRSHIAQYGGSPERIFLFGHSSGCLLASLLGTDESFLQKEHLKVQDIAGVVAMGCRLNDVIDAAGATPEQIRKHFEKDIHDQGFGSIKALNQSVPTAHVNGRMPSFLILIAEEEQIHPPILEDAKVFIAAAQKAGGRASYEVLPGLTHYQSIHNARKATDPTFRRVLAFVAK